MSEPESVRSLNGLRWQCGGSGACCRAGYNLGPVEDEIAEGIDASDVGAWWPAAADGWAEMRPGPDGRLGRFIRSVDGACIFLRDDELCAVHAQLGELAKPAFCRLFPYTAVRDPKGIAVGVRPGCHGFHAMFDEAPLATPTRLREAAMEASVAIPRTFDPQAVRVFGGRGVSLEDWMHLEERILQALEAPAQPSEAARSGRRVLQTAMPGGWPALPADVAERAWADVSSVLHQQLRPLSDPTGSGPRHERVVAVVHLLERAMQAPREVPVLESRAAAYVQLQRRSQVLIKGWAAVGSVLAGLGAFELGVQVAARAWPERPVPAEAFGPNWAMWHDVVAHPQVQAVFQAAARPLEAFYLALGAE